MRFAANENELSGFCIDRQSGRIHARPQWNSSLSPCRIGRIMVISDPDTGKVVTTVPIGAGPDAASFDPASGLVFSSNGGDGTMTIIQLRRREI